MDWNNILETLTPTILSVASLIITAILGVILNALPPFIRMFVDQKAAQSIHNALMNGLRAALNEGLSGDAAVAKAVAYTETSAKGSIDHFAKSKTPVTISKLQDQAKAKVATVKKELNENPR